MTKLLATLCLVLGLAFGVSADAHAAVESGKPAPDISFTDIDGATHSIAALKGKTIILEWTNDGCPFVQKFYKVGEMQRLQKEATARENTVWFTINSGAKGEQGYLESDEAAKKFIADNGFASTAYVRDVTGAFGKLYGAKTTPHMYVINPEGVLVYQGAIDSIKSVDSDDIAKATNYLTEALKAVDAGTLPTHTSTEAYGCNVKYAN